MKTFLKHVTKQTVYKQYVKVINGLLQLSDREAELLALLLELNDNMTNSSLSISDNILSTDNRRIIMAKTMINKNNLVKYIKSLVDKGVLTKSDSGYKLVDIVIPKIANDELAVCFKLNISK